ncbi:TPA: prepilin-type N-terminal cleavage/methylation domain-containing protein, partial [Escherichia coli]|nr:prepilin-type N-terminal cleavage/methylation domain-containing protein [Escherichia coli]HBB3069618.1 prepilin-type N-terminal cleavage/methylation domain-containing protein [Escherichia coli]
MKRGFTLLEVMLALAI